jgi:glycosyltransferase involved in cell wall biosynthesis
MDCTIVIPFYNEEKYIKKCLTSIIKYKVNFTGKLEIIAVNNGSTDKSVEIVSAFPVTLIEINRQKISKARNVGGSQAKGKIIAFVDGDVEVTKEWFLALNELIKDVEADDCILSGYPCLVPENGGWIEKYWFGYLKDRYLGGANLILSRSAFHKLNGFDENLTTGEDYDLCLRAIENNVNYCPNKDFKAYHLGFPNTLTGFIRREIWHGLGDFRSIKDFLKSIVAQIAMIYLFLIILSVYFIYKQNYTASLISLLLLITVNACITVKRFQYRGHKIFVIQFVLNLIYFVSRFISLLKRLYRY